MGLKAPRRLLPDQYSNRSRQKLRRNDDGKRKEMVMATRRDKTCVIFAGCVLSSLAHNFVLGIDDAARGMTTVCGFLLALV